MLVIEGIDGTGKTTLAKKLIRHLSSLNMMYQHMSVPGPNWNYLHSYLERIQPRTVQDRFHLGANAYGQGPVTVNQLRAIDGAIKSVGGFTVLLICDDEELTPDELWKMDKLREANAIFNSVPDWLVEGRYSVAPKSGGFISDDRVEEIAVQYMMRQGVFQ